jgi:hypothetical protein
MHNPLRRNEASPLPENENDSHFNWYKRIASHPDRRGNTSVPFIIHSRHRRPAFIITRPTLTHADLGASKPVNMPHPHVSQPTPTHAVVVTTQPAQH